jgi:hypothetical protein
MYLNIYNILWFQAVGWNFRLCHQVAPHVHIHKHRTQKTKKTGHSGTQTHRKICSPVKAILQGKVLSFKVLLEETLS